MTFNFKKEWFEKIARNEKIIEYREVKPYWTKRLKWLLDNMEKNDGSSYIGSCLFVLGYTKKKILASVTKIEIVDGKDTDLHIDKPVYAIHFELEAEYDLK